MSAAWKRILVRLPNWVGDVVMATPALRAIRQHAPDAKITVLVKSYAAPVIRGLSSIDEFVELSTNEERGLRASLRLAKKLRTQSFDAAILLTNSLTSALPIAMARIPTRIGYRGDWRSPLLTDTLAPKMAEGRRRPIPMPLYYQQLLDCVGIASAGSEYELPMSDSALTQLQGDLRGLGRNVAKPLLVLNPGARFGSSKLWAPERFVEVGRRFQERGYQPIVLCGPGEERLAGGIACGIGHDVLDTSQKPLPLEALPALFTEAALVLTTDSGPRHVAAWAKKPTVVVMGPTYPEWTAWNLERQIVVRHQVLCGPCHLRRCPTNHACMLWIEVDEVVLALERVLSLS